MKGRVIRNQEQCVSYICKMISLTRKGRRQEVEGWMLDGGRVSRSKVDSHDAMMTHNIVIRDTSIQDSKNDTSTGRDQDEDDGKKIHRVLEDETDGQSNSIRSTSRERERETEE